MRTLQHRTNNAYDTILLLDDGGKVIGEWQTTRDDAVWHDYCDYGDPRDLEHWEITNPDCTDPDDYGKLSDIVPLGHFWDAHDVKELFVAGHRRLSGYRTRAAARDGSIGEPVWETNARHEARLKRPPKEEGDET